MDDYTLTPKPIDDKDQTDHVGFYETKLKLSEKQKDRIALEIFDELEAIKRERESEGLDAKFDNLDAQYEGDIEEVEDQQFNVHHGLTKEHIDGTVGDILEAKYGSDPVYSVSPRPGFEKQGGEDVCNRQEDFLDYKLDEVIPIREVDNQVIHSSVLKGVGIKKIAPEVEKEKIQREEQFEGTPIKQMNPETGEVVVVANEGLEKFLKAYPDAVKRYPVMVQKLVDGKKINFIVEEDEYTYNDPLPTCVDLKNFFVRLSTDGYRGLKTTKLIAERINYSWWDLKKLEEKGDFFDVDELMYKDAQSKKAGEKIEKHESETWDVLLCTFHTKIEEDDEDFKKVLIWVAEDRRIVIGSKLYDLYGVPCMYIPHYIKRINAGFYQPGIGEDLTDDNITMDAMLNFLLEGLYIKNMITPITPEGSDIDRQFLEKRWAQGVPLNALPGEVDFLQKYMPQIDVGGILSAMQYVKQSAESKDGRLSSLTGRESPVDPNAPASKTLALMRAGGKRTTAYIKTMLKSFNHEATILLAIYYQMDEQSRHYRIKPRPGQVTGDKTFGVISREDMIARTNIQSQAFTFHLEKQREKQENVVLYQLMRQEPLIAQNPMAVYELNRSIIKSWSPKWKNLVDRILLTPQQLQQQIQQTAVQGVAQYVQLRAEKAHVTGEQTPPELQELIQMIQPAVSEIATPPSEEVVKEREKAAKEAQ